MMETPKPEAWIGRRIAITLNVHNPDEFGGELEEVNDRGITVVIGPGSPQETLAFYPWGSIRRVRLREEKDARTAGDAGKSGQRLAGDPGWFS